MVVVAQPSLITAAREWLFFTRTMLQANSNRSARADGAGTPVDTRGRSAAAAAVRRGRPRPSATTQGTQSKRAGRERDDAGSAAVAAPQNQAWVPTSPSKGSSVDEDQEREVFEL